MIQKTYKQVQQEQKGARHIVAKSFLKITALAIAFYSLMELAYYIGSNK
jgi:hypothetical protein